MGFIYLSYVCVLAVLIFIECRKNNQKKWWAGVVLLLPLAAPVLLLRTQKGRGKRMIMVAMPVIALAMVLGGEWFMYSLQQKKTAEDTLPPVLKKIIQLNEDVKQTTIDIYNASGKLESLSMAQSRIGDMEKTIENIQQMRELVKENQKAIDRLIAFAEEHETFFYRKNLDWIFEIRNFYTDHNVVQHHISREKYLAAFEDMVQYTYDNYENIMEKLSSKHMKTYDVYYMRYRQAADSHNRFNRKRIAFQKEFIEKYPEVKPFLPGSHHLEPFKFWDKFAF